jgi:hypothetical protein
VLGQLVSDPTLATRARALAHERFEERFRWTAILSEYERLLAKMMPMDKAAYVPESLPVAEDA